MAWMVCVYYLSWDGSRFFDTSQQIFWKCKMGTMGHRVLHRANQRGDLRQWTRMHAPLLLRIWPSQGGDFKFLQIPS